MKRFLIWILSLVFSVCHLLAADVPQYSLYLKYQISGTLREWTGQPVDAHELTESSKSTTFKVDGADRSLEISATLLNVYPSGFKVELDTKLGNADGTITKKSITQTVGFDQRTFIEIIPGIKCDAAVSNSSDATRPAITFDEASQQLTKPGVAAASIGSAKIPSIAVEIPSGYSFDEKQAYAHGYLKGRTASSLVIFTSEATLREARILGAVLARSGVNVSFCVSTPQKN